MDRSALCRLPRLRTHISQHPCLPISRSLARVLSSASAFRKTVLQHYIPSRADAVGIASCRYACTFSAMSSKNQLFCRHAHGTETYERYMCVTPARHADSRTTDLPNALPRRLTAGIANASICSSQGMIRLNLAGSGVCMILTYAKHQETLETLCMEVQTET